MASKASAWGGSSVFKGAAHKVSDFKGWSFTHKFCFVQNGIASKISAWGSSSAFKEGTLKVSDLNQIDLNPGQRKVER